MTKYLGTGFYGLQPPPWVSGESIAKGQWLASPADNEIYQRIAATGTDTVDPADDVVKYVARSYERTSAVTGVMVTAAGTAAGVGIGATRITVGALAVGARTSVLSVTGRGCIDYLIYHKGALGSARVELIVDGRPAVFDQTDSTYATNAALMVLGMVSSGAAAGSALVEARFDPAGVQFRRSLEVFITNTATAGGATAAVAYHLRSIG